MFDPENVFDEIVKYFVRGAKCVLTENLETKLGLGKGTEGIYVDVVWEDEKKRKDLDKLPIGEVTQVEQPDYIIIRIDEKDKNQNISQLHRND